MTGGMAKYWINPRVGDKELPRVVHQLASCSLIFYVLMFLSTFKYKQVRTLYLIKSYVLCIDSSELYVDTVG